MLTANVNLEDRLVKCQLGTKKHIQKDNNNKPSKTYVKFDSFQTIVKRKSKRYICYPKFITPN